MTEASDSHEEIRRRLPDWAKGSFDWISEPHRAWTRRIVAVLLIVFGFLGFLPFLGFWMIPLGVFLLGVDYPPIQKWTLRGILWIEAKWKRLRGRGQG